MVALCVAVWCAATGAGFSRLTDYGNTPGPVGDVPAVWPAGVAEVAPGARATLLLFVHGGCPCTRATLAELARIVARAGSGLAVRVHCRAAPGEVAEQGPLWRAAAAIDGVRVCADPGGEVALRFGAATSGFAVLYDATGRLAFAGGITAARGHEGDNVGADAVVALARGVAPAAATTPVFGCGLVDGGGGGQRP